MVCLLNTEWSISFRRWAACSWRAAASAQISWNWQTPTFADPSLPPRRLTRNSICPPCAFCTTDSPCRASRGTSPPRPRRNNGSACPPPASSSYWREFHPAAASPMAVSRGLILEQSECLPLAGVLVFPQRSFPRRKFFSDWCPTAPPRKQ